MSLFDKLRRPHKPAGLPEFKITGLETVETITNGDVKMSYILIDETGKRHKFRSPEEMPPGVRTQFHQWEADDRIRDALAPEQDLSAIYPTEWGKLPWAGRSGKSAPLQWSQKTTSKSTFVTISHPCPDCGREIAQTNPQPGEPYTCPGCGATFVDQAPGQSLEELHRIIESKLRSPEAVRTTRERLGDVVIADNIEEVRSLSSYGSRELAIRARDALKDAGIDAVLSFDMEPGTGEEASTNLELCVPPTDGGKAAAIIETLDLCEPYAVTTFTDTEQAELACDAMRRSGLDVSLKHNYHDENVGYGTALMIKPRDWEKVQEILEKQDLMPHDVLGTYTDLARAQEAKAALQREGITVLLRHMTGHPVFGTGTAILARPAVSQLVADLLVKKGLLPDNFGSPAP